MSNGLYAPKSTNIDYLDTRLPVLNVYRLKMRAIPFMAHLFFDFHRIFGAGMDLEVDTEVGEKE